MTVKEKKYLTPKELSEHWDGRIKVRTINNWRQNGSGPPFLKLGGAILYRVEDIKKWDDERTVHSTSQYSK